MNGRCSGATVHEACVLIVDDHEGVRESVRDVVEMIGCSAMFGNGRARGPGGESWPLSVDGLAARHTEQRAAHFDIYLPLREIAFDKKAATRCPVGLGVRRGTVSPPARLG